MYIDTHCHLSKEDYLDIDQIVQDNRKNLIDKIIISGCTRDTIEESYLLSKNYEDIYLSIGYHPSEASVVSDEDIQYLESLLKEKKVVAVGEIGLDYHYGKESVLEQKALFRLQLSLAEKYHLPVVIHSRDATLDTISILKEFPNVKGDIHCFSGSVETAFEYISMGYKLGIGGVVTFKNSNLYKVVEAVGLDAILLETDAPYLTPVPFRGEQNSSKYIPLIAEKIAEILEVPVLEVASVTSKNAIDLFDLL